MTGSIFSVGDMVFVPLFTCLTRTHSRYLDVEGPISCVCAAMIVRRPTTTFLCSGIVLARPSVVCPCKVLAPCDYCAGQLSSSTEIFFPGCAALSTTSPLYVTTPRDPVCKRASQLSREITGANDQLVVPAYRHCTWTESPTNLLLRIPFFLAVCHEHGHHVELHGKSRSAYSPK